MEEENTEFRMNRQAAAWKWLLGGIALFGVALLLMRFSAPEGVRCEAVRIDGPLGKPSLGYVWTPREPREVIVIGHGVTENQSAMTTVAKGFAACGFVAVTFDFWGHGLSRERFDWRANKDQVLAWCAWARATYPGMRLTYLGHSMGGFAGGEAFAEKPDAVDAFVSLGALPPEMPRCKTLIAAGRFEELFTPEQAAARMGSRDNVVSSFWSDHMLEPWDVVLLGRMVRWVKASGGEAGASAPLVWRGGLVLPAAGIGALGALCLAAGFLAALRRPVQHEGCAGGPRQRRFSTYRFTARLLGAQGESAPPRSSSLPFACAQGLVFAAVLIVALAAVLHTQVFTCAPTHPERLVTWLIFWPFFALLSWLSLRALERAPLPDARLRFAVNALTKMTPLLLLGWVLRWVPGMAFFGMILWIFAFIFLVLAAVHALATKASGDWRAGAMAVSVVSSWLFAFWLPLAWPWIR